MPLLFATVSKHLMHGPCGDYNEETKKSPCMKNGKCKKGYPRAFCQQPTTDTSGYAQYTRRDNGRAAPSKHGVVMDNRWVVPYNPDMVSKLDIYVRSDVCLDVSGVHYVFKSIFKGHGCAVVTYNDGTNDVYATIVYPDD